MRATVSLLAIAAATVMAMAAAQQQAPGVHCSRGTFAHVCPNAAPVCCFNRDGSSGGCCHEYTSCDESTGGCRRMAPLPPGEHAVPLADTTQDVHFTYGALAIALVVMLSILCVAFVAVFLMATLKRCLRQRREAVRRRQQEQKDAEAADQVEVTSDDERQLRQECLQRAKAGGGGGGSGAPDEREADEDTPLTVQCAVCQRGDVNCMLFDCEHTVVCFDCAKRLKRCPECKKVVKRRKRLYLA